MTAAAFSALVGAMFALSVIPDASTMAVVARAMASGLLHGAVTVLGIIAGDVVFILIAVYSLSAVAESMAGLFIVIKYLAAAYLLWLGFRLWTAAAGAEDIDGVKEPSWLANFSCGLFITLGDPKAILFYLSFLPAFVDLGAMTVADTGMIVLAAAIAVTAAKMGYAVLADRARSVFRNERARRTINRVAGSVMILTGAFLTATA